MGRLKNIIEGWRNYLGSDEAAKKVALERSRYCSSCEHAKESGVIAQLLGDTIKQIQGYTCGICDCPLSTKLRDFKSSCPHPDGPKWTQVN